MPLRVLLEPLEFAWGIVQHLHSVMNTTAWREAHDALQPQVVAFSLRLSQSEPIYRAYVARASAGETDNTGLIDTILSLRADLAELLGYASHAEVSLATTMAGKVDAVDALIARLRAAAHPAAGPELESMRAFAAAHGQSEPLMNWDVAYWSERMREELFGFSTEDLRPYFQFPRVLDGLFELAQQLFGITVLPANEDELPHRHQQTSSGSALRQAMPGTDVSGRDVHPTPTPVYRARHGTPSPLRPT